MTRYDTLGIASSPVPPTNIFPTHINNLDIFFATSIHSFGHKEIGVVTGSSEASTFLLFKVRVFA